MHETIAKSPWHYKILWTWRMRLNLWVNNYNYYTTAAICFDQNNDLQTNTKIKEFDEHFQMVTKCENDRYSWWVRLRVNFFERKKGRFPLIYYSKNYLYNNLWNPKNNYDHIGLFGFINQLLFPPKKVLK
jgi:hypothetical protein